MCVLCSCLLAEPGHGGVMSGDHSRQSLAVKANNTRTSRVEALKRERERLSTTHQQAESELRAKHEQIMAAMDAAIDDARTWDEQEEADAKLVNAILEEDWQNAMHDVISEILTCEQAMYGGNVGFEATIRGLIERHA